MNRTQLTVLSLSSLGLAAIAQARPTFDITEDFTIASNPNGQWSYGTIDGGNFVLNTGIQPEPYPGWFGPGSSNIWKNNSNSVEYGVQPGQVTLHPGSSEQPIVARWTAPLAGAVDLDGMFFAGDTAELDYAIRHNGAELFHVRTFGDAPFNLTPTVSVGDTIDFMVYGGYFFGNTPLETTLDMPRTSEWANAGGGTYSVAANWTGDVPNGFTDAANFLSAITAPATVTMDRTVKLNSVTFDNPNRYTIVGAGHPFVMAAPPGSTGTITVVNGSHTIDTEVHLVKDTVVNVTGTASTLTVGPVTATSSSLTKSGAGMLELARYRDGTLNISGGTVSVVANGTDTVASKLSALTITGGATPTASLDLNDNDAVISNATPTQISAAVSHARNGGAWDQPGITSSTARNHPQQATTLGVMNGAEFTNAGGGSTFAGLPFAATDALVKYTWYGDADFNGEVNFDDYVRTDGGFNGGLAGWVNGDFDFSGGVDFDDYVLIDLGFNAQGGTLRRAQAFLSGDDRSLRDMDSPALRQVQTHFEQFGIDYARSFLSAVPEPTIMVPLFLTGLIARRSRRSCRAR